MTLEMVRLRKLNPKRWPIDMVLMYDSQMDFRSIMNNALKLKAYLESEGIPMRIVRSDKSVKYEMTERPVEKVDKEGNAYIQKGYGFCGNACRWATGLKIEALRKVYSEILKKPDEPVIEYIGYAVNERSRIKRERNGNKFQCYPLVEWGWDEKKCLDYCFEHGWHWYEESADGELIELYDLLDRVSCYCCQNKNQKELKVLCDYREKLPYWNMLKDLQAKIDRPFKKTKTVDELEAKFTAFDGQLTLL